MRKVVSTAKEGCKKILPSSLYRHLVSAAGDWKRTLYALRSGGRYSIYSQYRIECWAGMQF